MSTHPGADPSAAEPEPSAPADLSPRGRSIGVIVWCSFLVGAAATMICFALIDPLGSPLNGLPEWWTTRRAVYAFGFLFFWGIAAAASVLTLYMARTEHRDDPPAAREP